MLQKRDAFLLILIATALLLIIGFFLILFVLYFLKRKREVFFEKEILKRNYEQALMQSQLEIQEQTLRQVGRELHDNLGHQASLIKIHLNTLHLGDIDKARQQVAETKDVTKQLIADIKALSVSLGSDRITNGGLLKALETEISRLNKTDQFTATLSVEGQIPTLESDKAIILFRMVQEVLNNAIKHSEATNISLMIEVGEDHLTLVLRDDGKGFDVEEKKKSGGAGLGNLQNRAKMINATVDMQSSPGAGSHTTIRVPQ